MEQKSIDWKSIVGMGLIFIILMYWFSQNQADVEANPETTTETSASTPDTTPQLTSNNETTTAPISNGVFQAGSNEVITFENDLIQFKIDSKGALIQEALLKSYKTYDSLPVYLAKPSEKDHQLDLVFVTNDGRKMHTKDMSFTPSQSMNGANKVLSFKANVGPSQFLEFRYELQPKNYMMDFTIRSQGLSQTFNTADAPQLNWEMLAYKRSKGMDNENRYTEIKFEYGDGSDDYTGQGAEADEEEDKVSYIAYKQHFFTSILLTDTPFKKAKLISENIASQDDEQDTYTKKFNSQIELEYTGGELAYNMDWYFGPTDYDILDGYDRNLDEVVDLGWGIFGWINEFVIRPLFSLLTKNAGIPYGIAIILLTICVRIILSPVLYKSYMTQAKMKILRPELNRIAEKYKDNAMKKQQETMRIQSEAGASPLSGCLPGLLQMPVFFALFKFFPTAFDLRQKSFLWADDLSSYDQIFKLPEGWDIPFYGDHVSLFPILASVAIFFYMQMTTGQTMQNTQQPGMPNMKFIMYLSPLFMLVFFNNYASGLSLYYFVSNLITIGIMLVIKNFVIKEDKVLAKIEKAKAAPKKKKGRFASKMSEIMEQAQAQQEEQKKGKK
ncbi:membrane protein insertase YidC [Nonlabens ulvanivorans]|uniref:Membrane protein insertase YidC n=1 Tax=Nonlabens ulvanivorans TaxID=906888 RepID=A0A084JVU6_NONUL|nr:membrane protein insertase YidC [Nonlabens ulvanivorans]KEZ93080.1 membrane protein [Nonlabens ulvanivorans]PRX13801.1 protein translocase subunit yidC [Nonlabens ulvanivorans]